VRSGGCRGQQGMRLAEKVGIVVGAGQSPGETVGTGRAAAITFAREGAKVLLVDRDLAAAQETAAIVAREGGIAACHQADWGDAAACQGFAQACMEAWGRIDFLQNNVGIGQGDADPLTLSEDSLDRILAVNLKGCLLSCQAVVPVMRDRGSGSIVNISSTAALAAAVPLTAYKISKAAINALGHSLAAQNAAHGVRVNTIMPGLLDTPMAIDAWAAKLKVPREKIRARRDAMVPLRARMGTGWDVANASLTPMRRASSPASYCRSTAASSRGSETSYAGRASLIHSSAIGSISARTASGPSSAARRVTSRNPLTAAMASGRERGASSGDASRRS